MVPSGMISGPRPEDHHTTCWDDALIEESSRWIRCLLKDVFGKCEMSLCVPVGQQWFELSTLP